MFTVSQVQAAPPPTGKAGLSVKHPPGTLKPVLSWETGEGKSRLIPALEIPGFLILLNLTERLFSDEVQDGKKVYDSTLSTTWDHIRKQNWEFDRDPFNVNQFGHPYQGATMYGFGEVGRPEFLGVAGLQQYGKLSLGDGWGNHSPLHQ